MKEDINFIVQALLGHEFITGNKLTQWEVSCRLKLKQAARNILGRYLNSEDLIEDCIQNALTSIYKRLRSSNAPRIDNPMGYLRTAIVNEALDIAEKLNKRETDYFSDYEDESPILIDNSLPPDKRIEIDLMLNYHLEHLSPQQQLIFRLDTLGLKPDEIAKTLDIKINTVYSEKFRIKSKLLPLQEYLTGKKNE